ncbi:hypothetical protein [Streptomyces sp. NPDC059247]
MTLRTVAHGRPRPRTGPIGNALTWRFTGQHRSQDTRHDRAP